MARRNFSITETPMYLGGVLLFWMLATGVALVPAQEPPANPPSQSPPTGNLDTAKPSAPNPAPEDDSKTQTTSTPNSTTPPPASPNSPQSSPPESTAEPPAAPPQAPATTDAAKPQATDTSKKGGSSHAAQLSHKKKRPSSKRVVREGGATESSTVIAPSMSLEQASHQRQTTAQLLSSTDANLQKLSNRQLNSNQSATIDQIHIFMQQAKAAVDAGDLQRGHNLALKAHLLSDDLVRH